MPPQTIEVRQPGTADWVPFVLGGLLPQTIEVRQPPDFSWKPYTISPAANVAGAILPTAFGTVNTLQQLTSLALGGASCVFTRENYAGCGGGCLLWLWDGTSVLADNGVDVANPSGANPGRWIAQKAPGYVDIAWAGAVRNGVVDDTRALYRAIAAAGVNGSIKWSGVCLASNPLLPMTGQTWWGYGATLKRADAVTARLTVGVTIGTDPGTIHVTSVAGFYVGQCITFFDAAFPATNYEGKNWQISAIDPVLLTMTLVAYSPLLTHSYAPGDMVSSGRYDMVAESDGVIANQATPRLRILGLALDGNVAHNPWGHWEMCAGIRVTADDGLIQHCLIFDAMSDGIIFEGNRGQLLGNWLRGLYGNGIHLGGAYKIVIAGNIVIDFMRGGADNGHPDGGIIASNLVYDTVISANYIETGNGFGAIGSWDSFDNFGLTVTGNYCKDCAYGFRLENQPTVPTSINGRLALTGNAFVNCGQVQILGFNAWTSTNGIQPITLTGNYFEETGLQLNHGAGIAVVGNAFWKHQAPGVIPTDSLVLVDGLVKSLMFACNALVDSADTTHPMVQLRGTSSNNIVNNTIFGGSIGVYATAYGGVYCNFNNVSGNNLREQYNCAIAFDAGNADNRIGENPIAASGGAVGYIGIQGCGLRALVTGNIIDLTNAKPCFWDAGSGSAAHSGTIFTNNKCMSTNGAPIQVQGYAFVLANFLPGGAAGIWDGSGGHATIGTNYAIN